MASISFAQGSDCRDATRCAPTENGYWCGYIFIGTGVGVIDISGIDMPGIVASAVTAVLDIDMALTTMDRCIPTS
jgi:hypothetical protein